MAILAFFNCQNMTRNQYEQAKKEVAWDKNRPHGMILHASYFDAGGVLRVVDLWDSEKDLKAFFDSRLGPWFAAKGLTLPKGEIFPLHNANVSETISRFVSKGTLPGEKVA